MWRKVWLTKSLWNDCYHTCEMIEWPPNMTVNGSIGFKFWIYCIFEWNKKYSLGCLVMTIEQRGAFSLPLPWCTWTIVLCSFSWKFFKALNNFFFKKWSVVQNSDNRVVSARCQQASAKIRSSFIFFFSRYYDD